MLEDVLAACRTVGPTILATERDQGEAVEAALRDAQSAPILVVNADLPYAQPRDLLTLLGAAPLGGMALVAARDGTTNALALPAPHLFASLYGPGSAERFRQHAERLGLELVVAEIPKLAEDVDSPQDLARLDGKLGTRTQAALSQHADLPR